MEEKNTNLAQKIFTLIKTSFSEWFDDGPFDLSAIVSYYAIFSMPGLLIIVITIAGLFVGEDAVEGRIQTEISEIIGKDAGEGVETMIANAYTEGSSTISTIIGIFILLFAASGVFAALQRSLNTVWGVKPDAEKYGIKRVIISRIISFGMILAIGFLLLISLILTSLLAFLSKWIQNHLSDILLNIFFVFDFIVSFGIITTMFALIYKFLPDVEIKWKSVWIGSVVTAFLFILGKYALTFYFSQTNPASAYGVAGYVILILLWISYSCMILFLGAEFTQVYTRNFLGGIKPKKYAIKIKN